MVLLHVAIQDGYHPFAIWRWLNASVRFVIQSPWTEVDKIVRLGESQLFEVSNNRMAPFDLNQNTALPSQRSLAAIVVTDTVGFSALTAKNEEHTLALVERDLTRMRVMYDAYGGRVIQTTGDGLILLFNSAVQAVSCSLEIQRDIQKYSLTVPPSDQLRHRIGIHLGDVFVNGNDVLGDGLNFANKLQSEADPGGVCISKTVYEVVSNRITLYASAPIQKKMKDLGKVTFCKISPTAGAPRSTKGVNVKKGSLLRYGVYGLLLLIGLGVVGGGIKRWRAHSASVIKTPEDQEFIKNTLSDIASVETELSDITPRQIEHCVKLSFTRQGFKEMIPKDQIFAMIDCFAKAGVNQIDMEVPTSSWGEPGNPESKALLKEICNHVHVDHLKLGLSADITPISGGMYADYLKNYEVTYPQIIMDLHPDEFIVLRRPSHLLNGLHIQSAPNESQCVQFVSSTISAIRARGGTIKMGAGGGIHEETFLRALLALPELNFISLDVYSIHQIKDYKTFVALAQHAGKTVSIQDIWRPSPPGAPHKLGTGIADSQYEDLDAHWISFMNRVAEATHCDSISYTWAPCFFLYQSGPVNGQDFRYLNAAGKAAIEKQTTKVYAALQAACGE